MQKFLFLSSFYPNMVECCNFYDEYCGLLRCIQIIFLNANYDYDLYINLDLYAEGMEG